MPSLSGSGEIPSILFLLCFGNKIKRMMIVIQCCKEEEDWGFVPGRKGWRKRVAGRVLWQLIEDGQTKISYGEARHNMISVPNDCYVSDSIPNFSILFRVWLFSWWLCLYWDRFHEVILFSKSFMLCVNFLGCYDAYSRIICSSFIPGSYNT